MEGEDKTVSAAASMGMKDPSGQDQMDQEDQKVC